MLKTRIPVFFQLFFYIVCTVAATVYNSGNILLVSQKKGVKLVSTQTTVVVTAVLTNGVIYGVVPSN